MPVATQALGSRQASFVIAVLCPGQGSQKPGLLTSWLEFPTARDQLAQWSEAADLDLVTAGTTADEETIKDTAVAQPLLVAAALLSWQVLVDQVAPEGAELVVAGHSVGEYSAAAVTGVLTPRDALALVALRGRGMAEAAAAVPTGMSAVLGGAAEDVADALSRHHLVPANVNGAGQVVAAGRLDDLAALAAAPPARARVIPLKVAGAFHTPFMASAVPALAEAMAAITPGTPAYRLLTNADGTAVTDGRAAAQGLVSQVTQPVRWDLCQDTLRDLGVTGVLELLPGGTLAGLAKRTLKGVDIVTLTSPDDLGAAVALLERHAA